MIHLEEAFEVPDRSDPGKSQAKVKKLSGISIDQRVDFDKLVDK